MVLFVIQAISLTLGAIHSYTVMFSSSIWSEVLVSNEYLDRIKYWYMNNELLVKLSYILIRSSNCTICATFIIVLVTLSMLLFSCYRVQTRDSQFQRMATTRFVQCVTQSVFLLLKGTCKVLLIERFIGVMICTPVSNQIVTLSCVLHGK